MIANFGELKAMYASFQRRDVGLRVPAVGKFGILRHDFQLEEYNYGPRQYMPEYEQMVSVPATRRFFKRPDFVPFTAAWAWRWLDMLRWASNWLLPDAEIVNVWRRMISNHVAFTDNHAPENGYHDPVTGENAGKRIFEWASLGMAGNLIKIVESAGQYRAIEAFDLSQPPPSLAEIIAQPWKWHWATEQSLYALGGNRWVVSNFPHLEVVCKKYNLPIVGLPVPLVSLGGIQWVKIEHFDRIDNGATYSPYVPEL